MNSIQQVVLQYLPPHRKTPSGWLSFNAVCCHHHGERPDAKGRGGVILSGDTVTYHCFNCGFKTAWSPGRHLSFKFRKLLGWLGLSEDDRHRLVFEALRLKEIVGPVEDKEEDISIDFEPMDLPDPIMSVLDAPQEIQDYCDARSLPKHKLLYSPSTEKRLNKRVILPYTWYNDIVGFTARLIKDPPNKIMKYYAQARPNYVYGIDNQPRDARLAIVAEGALDALVINGVSPLNHEVNDTQAQIIDSLGREIILIPDRGQGGQILIDKALQYGWSVSFPEWHSDVKDPADAVQKYGPLLTVKSIIDAREHSSLKINLLRRKW